MTPSVSVADWIGDELDEHETHDARDARRQARTIKAPARGTRRFADLVAELQHKHGVDVDLSGLRAEYVSAYETAERITIERDGRTYRGTVGATRGNRPRFVLLLSLDL